VDLRGHSEGDPMNQRRIQLPWILISSFLIMTGCRSDENLPTGVATLLPVASTTSLTLASPTMATPATEEIATIEPERGMWIGRSLYAVDSPQRFSLRFGKEEWQIVEDERDGVLSNRDLDDCEIRPTAGRGLGPGWRTVNGFVMIGDVGYESVEVYYQEVLQFVNLYTGDESGFYAGFQVGVENLKEGCLDRAYFVLETFEVQ
jgi:hypothetical protein